MIWARTGHLDRSGIGSSAAVRVDNLNFKSEIACIGFRGGVGGCDGHHIPSRRERHEGRQQKRHLTLGFHVTSRVLPFVLLPRGY